MGHVATIVIIISSIVIITNIIIIVVIIIVIIITKITITRYERASDKALWRHLCTAVFRTNVLPVYTRSP